MADNGSGGMAASARPAAVRRLGRFELRQLIGRSQRTMAWRVFDPRVEQELLLVLPRGPLASDDGLRAWEAVARRAARLGHPLAAHAVEVGVHERFPYVAYDFDGSTLSARLTAGQPLTARESATVLAQISRVLAFAHEAGLVHGDVQPYMICLSAAGQVKIAGLEVAGIGASTAPNGAETDAQRAVRLAEPVDDDVQSLGVLMHWMLSGRPALDEQDIGVVLARMPPKGGERFKLTSTAATGVPEPLRAILHRATSGTAAHRYPHARAYATALEGWLKGDSPTGDGLVKALLDKIRTDGLLPAAIESRDRMASLRQMENETTAEMAELLLGDLAIGLELLRVVNTAGQRDPRKSGTGDVLTLRRAVAMIGLDGVRRAALALRPWPGQLRGQAIEGLDALMERCRCAGRVARFLRPQGYDTEVVYLVTVMQNLARLALQYHMPEQAAQIRALMNLEPMGSGTIDPEATGIPEDMAAYSVIGMDLGSLSAAVGRYLGLGQDTLDALKRIPPKTMVQPGRSDEDILRITASCANDCIDALELPPERAALALSSIVTRYGRGMRLSVRDLKDALIPNGLTDEISRAWSRAAPGQVQDDADDDW
ncbi:MAG: HDOD domain-containing protein [Rubrivivax sp.]